MIFHLCLIAIPSLILLTVLYPCICRCELVSYMASRFDTTDLIPIYYRIPFGVQNEIVAGYLEKKHVDDGKRFYGQFRCEDCGHEWHSGHTWEGYRQECNKCYLKNWPEEVYHLEQSAGPISEEPHREDLCEKCQMLGYNCQETHESGGFKFGRNNKFDQCFNKQFELWRYDILLEPRFIQDLFDCLWDDLDTSDRSEFKDALEFALENWKIKGEDEQITACEDLLWQIDDASQRESRNRKRSAFTNKSLSPTDPGTFHASYIPLNDDFDELAWYPYYEDTFPRSIVSPGKVSPYQPIGSSPRPSAWNAVATPDISARVKREFNQTSISTVYPVNTVHPVKIPLTKTNYRDEHPTPQLTNDTVSYTASIPVNTTNLIPIYYRVPFGAKNEIVSGYLEKKHVENGKKFYGHFRCEDCGHEWRSGNTWQGYRQECNTENCKLKNWPEKVYHLEQSAGLINEEPHRQDLCEKCQRLGHNCQETYSYGVIRPGRNNKFDQCFNKQFELLRYDILLEPQFIQDLYDCLWGDLDASDRSEFKDALKFALENWKIKGEDEQITACEDLLWQIEALENNPAPGSEFKDALTFGLGKWKKEQNENQITACEDLVQKIEVTSQRKSRTRKRGASSNKSFGPTDPGTLHNSFIPLNNGFDALAWYPHDEDNSPRSIVSSGRTAPNQPIGSSPRPSVWNAVDTPDTSARVKRGFNQIVPPVQIPVRKTNHRDEHSTPQPTNDTPAKPKISRVPQPSSNSIYHSVLSQTNNNTTAPQTSNNNLIVLPHSNPVIQLNKNSSSHSKNNPAPQPNINPSSHSKNNPGPQPNNNPSSRRKNNPGPQPNNNPSSHSKNNPAPQANKNPSSRRKNNPPPQPNKNSSSGTKNSPAPQPNNNPPSDPNDNLTVDPDEDPVRILSMLTVLLLAIAMLVYFIVL